LYIVGSRRTVDILRSMLRTPNLAF
jgi:hypothetical protein